MSILRWPGMREMVGAFWDLMELCDLYNLQQTNVDMTSLIVAIKAYRQTA